MINAFHNGDNREDYFNSFVLYDQGFFIREEVLEIIEEYFEITGGIYEQEPEITGTGYKSFKARCPKDLFMILAGSRSGEYEDLIDEFLFLKQTGTYYRAAFGGGGGGTGGQDGGDGGDGGLPHADPPVDVTWIVENSNLAWANDNTVNTMTVDYPINLTIKTTDWDHPVHFYINGTYLLTVATEPVTFSLMPGQILTTALGAG